jgi:hypothetical protein
MQQSNAPQIVRALARRTSAFANQDLGLDCSDHALRDPILAKMPA